MHLCKKCGFAVDKKLHLHSSYTDFWYCTDIDGCTRREDNDWTWAEIIEFNARLEAGLAPRGSFV